MRVLGLIPARGGSKGVPRKNVRELMGKPLIVYTIEAAKESGVIDRLVLSTDDDEIAAVGEAHGVELIRRPDELARDDTPTLPVVLHAMNEVVGASSTTYDAVCLLQPTNPLRTPGLIRVCIERLGVGDVDAVVTVLAVPDEYNPHWVYFETPEGHLHLSTGEEQPIARRQLLPPAYHREGSVYVTKWDTLHLEHTLYGRRLAAISLDAAECVNIDTEDDWRRAESLLQRNGRRPA